MTSYQQGEYTLRKLTPGDWRLYKSIRLEALQTDPQVFGSNYNKEAQFPEDTWKERLADDTRAFFGLFYNEELIGITGIIATDDMPATGLLVASFIRAPHRGKKLSALFYKARIDWAHEHNYSRIIVSHRSSNLASKAANQRSGFTYTHTTNRTWPDGVAEDELFYELRLIY